MDYLKTPIEELQRIEAQAHASGETERAAMLSAIIDLRQRIDGQRIYWRP